MEITSLFNFGNKSRFRYLAILLVLLLSFPSCKRDIKDGVNLSVSDSLDIDTLVVKPYIDEGSFSKSLETKVMNVQIISKGSEDLKNLEMTIKGMGANKTFTKAIRYDGIISDAVTGLSLIHI